MGLHAVCICSSTYSMCMMSKCSRKDWIFARSFFHAFRFVLHRHHFQIQIVSQGFETISFFLLLLLFSACCASMLPILNVLGMHWENMTAENKRESFKPGT